MGFNRRKLEAERKAEADAEAAARRAADAQVLADAERLIAAWNERQARRMPLLFAPTIGAALAARHASRRVGAGDRTGRVRCYRNCYRTGWDGPGKKQTKNAGGLKNCQQIGT